MRQVLFTKEEIIEACNSSPTMAQAAKKLDLPYKILRRLAKEYGCFKINPGGKGVKGESGPKISMDDILTGKAIFHNVNNLRKRLLKEGIKPHTCEKCGLSEWLGQPIPLELHHLDGNSTNHLLNNLQLLCNNCHTLTDNYRGKGRTIPLVDDDIIKMIPQSYTASDCIRNLGKRPQKHYISKVHKLKEQHNLEFIPNHSSFNVLDKNPKLCVDCGKPGYSRATRCHECYNRFRQETRLFCKICGIALARNCKTGMCSACYNSNRQTKIIWPSKEELEKMVWEMPTTKIAKQLNVCDNSVGKKCKQYGIKKPGLGYWAKKYNNKL